MKKLMWVLLGVFGVGVVAYKKNKKFQKRTDNLLLSISGYFRNSMKELKENVDELVKRQKDK